MCEAFNKAILQARDKPVITLMEMIRNYIMKRLVRKRAEVEKWNHDIGPNVFKVVERLKLESSIYHPEYSALLSSNRDLIDYIHNKYKKENFIKAYAPVIYGINGPMMWPKTNDKPLKCPLFKKQRGRPTKARALQADEVRVGGKTKFRRNYVVVRCSMCKQKEHNKSTCERRGGGNLDGSETRQ
ncbi:hypothetical protein LWI28_020450 [Acer negundo]|uniref:Uncharacterized protein n=1 Tax=Acer negundo TaxID=4023 RepID=A0AAD5IMH5_ACENE|nr:hypothetical protein LWI28_020450 [Acer negundo]